MNGSHVRLEDFAACDSLEGLQRLLFDHLMKIQAEISIRMHTHILNATAVANGERDASDVCDGVSWDMADLTLYASVLATAVTVASMRIKKGVSLDWLKGKVGDLARPVPSLDDRGEESQVVPDGWEDPIGHIGATGHRYEKEEPDCGPPDQVLVW